MKGNWKHGKDRTGQRSKVYSVYRNMRSRCENPRVRSFKDYGGRGIMVCEAWKSFDQFYRDMGDPPVGTTLGRIDNDLGYSPGNCRWETDEQQRNNRRNNRYEELDGRRMTLAQWARFLGVTEKLLERRLAIGWSFERAAKTPKRGSQEERT